MTEQPAVIPTRPDRAPFIAAVRSKNLIPSVEPKKYLRKRAEQAPADAEIVVVTVQRPATLAALVESISRVDPGLKPYHLWIVSEWSEWSGVE